MFVAGFEPSSELPGSSQDEVAPVERAAIPSEHDPVSDAELLNRYVELHDAASFERLVQRHQRMVMGVAFRILDNAQGAEDVLQETFFQLARLAKTIRVPNSLAGWLHKVAANAALQMLLSNKRRMSREAKSITPPPLPGPGPETSRRLRSLVDTSLADLPEKYRLPVILCYLEGRTHEEAAARLGYPVGSMSTLLTRALDLLRAKVRGRGGEISGATLLAVLCADWEAGAPAFAAELAGKTVGTGAVLGGGAQGASLALLAPLKTAALGALLVLGTTGTGLLIQTPYTPPPSDAAVRDIGPAAGPSLRESFGADGLRSLPAAAPLPAPAATPPRAHAKSAEPHERKSPSPSASQGKGPRTHELPDLPGSASERARAGIKALDGGVSSSPGAEAAATHGRGPGFEKPPGGGRSAEAARAAAAAARATQERARQAAGKGNSGK